MSSVKLIPGEGSLKADIVFVGEAPGEEEDLEGRPFVGRSGKKLEKWINEFLGLSRDEVYITNVVKVRPEGNRTPTYEEINSWKSLLWDEIAKIDPIIIVAVGSSATKALLNENFKDFAPNRGKIALTKRFAIFPIYHPSYILRAPGAEKLVRADFEVLKEYLDEYHKAREPG
jgi:DNA polymerase